MSYTSYSEVGTFWLVQLTFAINKFFFEIIEKKGKEKEYCTSSDIILLQSGPMIKLSIFSCTVVESACCKLDAWTHQ